jgi:ribonuclease HI
MIVEIFTDGACRGNPGPGGWAALLRYESHEKIIKGYQELTTNNRMELMGVIQAFQLLKRPCKVAVYTDSKYVCQGMTQWIVDWKRRNWLTSSKQPVKNQDLWERLGSLVESHVVTWHWVKGHSGHIENEKVDALANSAIDENIKNIR